jgi:hypothetical protein
VNLKSALTALVLGSGLVCAGQAMAAPSSALNTICANAFGVVEQKSAPTVYVESLTLQNMQAAVVFADGTKYIIWPNNATPQGEQTNQIRSLVKLAYLTGTKVNLCVSSLNEIWAVELAQKPRAPWLALPE